LQHGGCRLASYILDPNFAFGRLGREIRFVPPFVRFESAIAVVKQRYSCSASWPTQTTTPPAPPSIFTRTIRVVRHAVIIPKLPDWVAPLFPLEKERHNCVSGDEWQSGVGWLDPLDRKARRDAPGTDMAAHRRSRRRCRSRVSDRRFAEL